MVPMTIRLALLLASALTATSVVAQLQPVLRWPPGDAEGSGDKNGWVAGRDHLP